MKTLIVYASKHGSTKKCAIDLEKKIAGEVTLCNLKKDNVTELNDFDQIIIGGSIYMGRVRKEVMNFTKENLTELTQKRVGLFICCMREKELAKEQIEAVFPKELLEISIVKDYFGGEFNFTKMNFLEKFIVKMVAKADNIELNTKGITSLIKLDRIDNFATLINKQ